MKTGDELKAALVKACQEAAVEMGSKLAGLPWFYRNTLKVDETIMANAA